MTPLFAAAVEVERVCQDAGFAFCFIGGLAVLRWGQPRMTADVDVTVMTGFGDEARYVDELLAHLSGRIADARAFALRHRTLLLRTSNGVNADVSLGAMPFEARSVERASAFGVGDGSTVTTCSAEDLVVHKAFAGRDKDWLDITGIVARQGRRLDRQLVWNELLPLLELKDDTDTAPRLRGLLGNG